MHSHNFYLLVQVHWMENTSVFYCLKKYCGTLLINSMDGRKEILWMVHLFQTSKKCFKLNCLLGLPSYHTTLTIVWLPFSIILEEKIDKNCRDGPSSKYIWVSSPILLSIIPLGAWIPPGWWHRETVQVSLTSLRKSPNRITRLLILNELEP